ncbi:MAG TPA: methionyl-tRNA formyltransferase [Gemmatimonadales bacterium]|jgi:methionyl-tRNA formyltransferase
MRVVFFGTPQFAVPGLAALLDAGIDVVAVVTQPDRPGGRSHSTLVAPPVKTFAITAGLPVWQPERPRGDLFLQQLRTSGADLGIVVAYGHILPAELLAVPPLGLVNVHASLLPRWRGAAPIQWAILSGDRQTGVGVMRIEAGLDTGAIWLERTTAIHEDDTAATLSDRLSSLGAEALLDALPDIAAGIAPRPQDPVNATYASKVDRALARIRWNEGVHEVSCRIRAMDPHPGAWSVHHGSDIKLFGPRIDSRSAQSSDPPGTMASDHGDLVVSTGGGTLRIDSVQPAGRRRMPSREWLRGLDLTVGARFE